MPNTPKTKLREEWNKWLFKEEGNTHTYKLPNSDEISDWWLARFQEELSLLEEKTKEVGRKKNQELHGGYDDSEYLRAYEQAISDVLLLLRQHKEELK